MGGLDVGGLDIRAVCIERRTVVVFYVAISRTHTLLSFIPGRPGPLALVHHQIMAAPRVAADLAPAATTVDVSRSSFLNMAMPWLDS